MKLTKSKRSQLLKSLAHLGTINVRVGKEPSEYDKIWIDEGLWLLVEPGGFTQINTSINQELIAHVVRAVKRARAKTCLDLYCGSGNFSIPLLAAGCDVWGVEMSESAILGARRAISAQRTEGWGKAEMLSRDCASFVVQLENEGRMFDCVVVDPPRAGAKDVAPHLAGVCSGTLVMVSCDPVTLARDLKTLVASGFVLESVTVFDMFPQTHHAETVAILQRSGTDEQ